MNFSVDVLVYHVLVLFQKKGKGSFPQCVGVMSTPVLPYSYMYSNATSCLLAVFFKCTCHWLAPGEEGCWPRGIVKWVEQL